MPISACSFLITELEALLPPTLAAWGRVYTFCAAGFATTAAHHYYHHPVLSVVPPHTHSSATSGFPRTPPQQGPRSTVSRVTIQTPGGGSGILPCYNDDDPCPGVSVCFPGSTPQPQPQSLRVTTKPCQLVFHTGLFTHISLHDISTEARFPIPHFFYCPVYPHKHPLGRANLAQVV